MDHITCFCWLDGYTYLVVGTLECELLMLDKNCEFIFRL